MDVFQAVNRWAETICAKQGKTPSGKEKREIIGEEILKLIRFPSMPLSVFVDNVVDTKILTNTEMVEMFMYFSVNRIPKEFSCFPRCLNLSNLQRCDRLEDSSWEGHSFLSFEFTESTLFSVDIPILLGGILISGEAEEDYTVTLKLNGKFVLEGCFKSDLTLENCKVGFHIIFEQYYLVNPDIPCILEASIKGRRFSYGRQSKKELVAKKVKFRFAGPAVQTEYICIAEILFRHLDI